MPFHALRLLLLTLLAFLISGAVSVSSAQLQIGVWLNEQQTRELTPAQLEVFDEAGISLIATEGLLPASALRDRFRVMPVLPLNYIHARSESLESGVPERRLQRIADHYTADDAFEVAGIVAGYHPDLSSENVRRFYDRLSGTINLPLLIVSNSGQQAPEAITTISHSQTLAPPAGFSASEAITLLPHFRGPNAIHSYFDSLKRAGTLGYDSVIFQLEDLEFLLDQSDYGPELLLAFITQSAESVSGPLPALSPETPPIRADVILILLLWLSFSIHFRFNPNYNRSVLRYFLSYPFMVEDILRRHIIMGGSTIVVYLQIALLWGLAVSSTVSALAGPEGMDALQYHYPILTGELSLFLISAAFALLFNFILLFWLISACYRQDIISQASTLFLWPMHLAFPLITVGISLSIIIPQNPIALLPALIMVVLNILAFYLASAAFGKEPTLGPALHAMATSILYTLLLGLGAFALWWQTDLLQVMLLALRISG